MALVDGETAACAQAMLRPRGVRTLVYELRGEWIEEGEKERRSDRERWMTVITTRTVTALCEGSHGRGKAPMRKPQL